MQHLFTLPVRFIAIDADMVISRGWLGRKILIGDATVQTVGRVLAVGVLRRRVRSGRRILRESR
jgi:hypothetical protein